MNLVIEPTCFSLQTLYLTLYPSHKAKGCSCRRRCSCCGWEINISTAWKPPCCLCYGEWDLWALRGVGLVSHLCFDKRIYQRRMKSIVLKGSNVLFVFITLIVFIYSYLFTEKNKNYIKIDRLKTPQSEAS